jgi:beta-lactamase superfamily II metal-dependent hydrolase
MYEIDFLPVGDGGLSGDAIAVRFTRADNGELAHVIIDAGFKDDGQALVNHVKRYFGVGRIELAILTHPDRDHIGGMGEVLRGVEVESLWLQNIAGHGGSTLPAAAAISDLLGVAAQNDTDCYEVFAGDSAFGGTLTILGPTAAYYEELVAEQVAIVEGASTAPVRSLGKAIRVVAQRFLDALPVETRFGDAGGTNPRNNSSTVTLLQVDGRQLLLTADAGVPALDDALDWAQENGILVYQPHFVQMPHHGSRHNASSDLLDRLLGPTGQVPTRSAFVSVVAGAEKHPSPRVVNGFMRRGYTWKSTAGAAIWHHDNAPPRDDYYPFDPMPPLDESLEEDEG